jgi:hypothetical protein
LPKPKLQLPYAQQALDAVHEEIGLDVGGGVEVIRVLKKVHDGPGGGRFLPATPEEIESGVFFATAAEWRAAQGEVHGRDTNGTASAGADTGTA